MLESLRGLGYSTETAVADIIDNSIAAGASKIDVHFEWAGSDSWVRIVDDGRGMTDNDLESAMRLGVRDPRSKRDGADLGRFGLGLKTASFSQARRLTVATRTAGSTVSCLRWDLDLLNTDDGAGWCLFEGPETGSAERLKPAEGMAQGTVVLWENVDRIVSEGFTADNFIDVIDKVEAHLAMVFHRLISSGQDALEIRINGRKIKPWDPFATGHPAKALESPEYRLVHTTGVVVQSHVLPHKDMLKSGDIESLEGPAGWIEQQGFYVYRNRRLLLAGGWLGLGERGRSWPCEEPYRLARLRVDIPNAADLEWKINVLKSTASIPVRLRPQLLRIASEARERARKVFAHRGVLQPASGNGQDRLADLWQARKTRTSTHYRIDRGHDLVSSILDRAGPLKSDILSMLRLVEETVPIQRIWLDTAEDKETPRTGFDDAPSDDVADALQSMFVALVRHRGLGEDEARERLGRTPPFDRFPAEIAKLEMKSDT